jgi:hypothetical protein
MDDRARAATRALAAGRVLIGASICLAPRLAARWVGDATGTPGARMVIRGLGARDAALGLGTLAALNEPAQLRRWLVLASGCDATDFVATIAGPAAPARPAVIALAAGAAAIGLGLAAAAQP